MVSAYGGSATCTYGAFWPVSSCFCAAIRPCFSGALFPAFSGCPSARSVPFHTCFPEGLRQHFPTGFQGFCSMCSIASAMLSFACCCSAPCMPSWNISSNTKKTADKSAVFHFPPAFFKSQSVCPKKVFISLTPD